MLKADIYFNGVIVCSISYDRIEPYKHEDMVYFYKQNWDLVAIVPKTHMIVVK